MSARSMADGGSAKPRCVQGLVHRAGRGLPVGAPIATSDPSTALDADMSPNVADPYRENDYGQGRPGSGIQVGGLSRTVLGGVGPVVEGASWAPTRGTWCWTCSAAP